MSPRVPPAVMAKKLVRGLRPQHPDAHYLKKVFQYVRASLDIRSTAPRKRLPELLTEAELIAFYDTLWQAQHLTHGVMLKLLLFTGIRNAELLQLRLTDIDLHTCQVRVTQGKGHQDRYALFPQSFRGELAQYLERRHRSNSSPTMRSGASDGPKPSPTFAKRERRPPRIRPIGRP
jgi:integrase/recombinase XerD